MNVIREHQQRRSWSLDGGLACPVGTGWLRDDVAAIPSHWASLDGELIPFWRDDAWGQRGNSLIFYYTEGLSSMLVVFRIYNYSVMRSSLNRLIIFWWITLSILGLIYFVINEDSLRKLFRGTILVVLTLNFMIRNFIMSIHPIFSTPIFLYL